MAVGRGSMERAAKAAGGDTAKKSGDKAQTPVRRLTISEIVGEPSYVEPPKLTKPVGKAVVANPAEPETASEKPVPKEPAVKDAVTASEKEAEGQIVYQKSSGMLERAAKPNERFGLGEAMPVYYF